LIRYSIAVPLDPSKKDESYKFPNVAQELICHSSTIAQAIVEGGWSKKEEEKEEKEDPSSDLEDDVDHD
jgi:hypothetical protein